MSADSECGGIVVSPLSPPLATSSGAEDPLAPVTISVINLVDLAGSERLSQAASEDVDREKLRQKEVRERGRYQGPRCRPQEEMAPEENGRQQWEAFWDARAHVSHPYRSCHVSGTVMLVQHRFLCRLCACGLADLGACSLCPCHRPATSTRACSPSASSSERSEMQR